MLPQKLARALRGLSLRGTQWFFANFFRLTLAAVGVSEWCLAWWLFPGWIEPLPAFAWIAGPLALYGFNRLLVTRRHRLRVVGPGQRFYSAFALTCLFCFSFLLVTGALWAGAKVFLEAIVVQARTVQAGRILDGTVDTGFRWLADAGMMLIAVAFTYGYTIGQSRLRVTQLRLRVPSVAPALAGLRIVQISDIHIGQNLTREQLARFVDHVNGLHPDLICITGDIADSPAADLETFLPVLGGLRATRGVVAILGNHDHYTGAEWVEAALRRLTHFVVLRDQQTTIEVNGGRLHIVGLDDRGRDWARGVAAVPHLATLLAAIPPAEPVLLLSHRPDIFPQAAAAGVALTLSGHTHGGQIGVPWLRGRVRNLAEFITPFDRGLFERDGSYLYVNCGLGVTGQRIRLSTPREITLIEVESSASCRVAA